MVHIFLFLNLCFRAEHHACKCLVLYPLLSTPGTAAIWSQVCESYLALKRRPWWRPSSAGFPQVLTQHYVRPTVGWLTRLRSVLCFWAVRAQELLAAVCSPARQKSMLVYVNRLCREGPGTALRAGISAATTKRRWWVSCQQSQCKSVLPCKARSQGNCFRAKGVTSRV